MKKGKTGTGVERITEKGNLHTKDRHRIAQAGNTLPMTHGAYTPRVVDPLARQMLETILGHEQIDYLNDPTYSFALWAWARAEVRVQLIEEYLQEHGRFDENGRETPAANSLAAAEGAAAKARQRLGLDPLSRAQLGKDMTSMRLDLARLWQHEEEQE
jgi:hypothetical protein